MDADYHRLVARVEDDHWWYVARRKIVRSVLENFGPPSDARLLDVGCGTGGNLEMLARFGRLRATEMNPYARQVAVGRGVCEVVEGWLPGNIPFEAGSFDVVTALDVIEHVEDDEAALDNLRSLLVAGGRLVVTVPAYQWLWSRHDETNHHIRRYTISQLSERLRSTGFQPVHQTYFNTWLFPVGAAARLADRWVRIGRATDMQLPPRLMNAALKGVFESECRFVVSRTLPFGLSVLAVARAGHSRSIPA